MKLIRTNRFKRDYKKLSQKIQKLTDKQLCFLVQNLSHPSLRVKRVRKYKDIYEASITMDYRLLFQIIPEGYILLRIGKHDILEK